MHVRPVARALIWTAILIVPYIIATFFFAPDTMTEIVATLSLLACGFAIFRWGKTAARVYLEGATSPVQTGILAIVIFSFFYASGRIYNVAFIRLDRPDYLINSYISPTLNYGIAVGVALFTIATRTEGEKPGKVMAVVTGALTAGAIFSSTFWPLVVAKGGALISFLSHFLPK